MLNLSKAQRKTMIVSAEGALSALHADSKYGFVLDSKDFKTFMHYYYYCISTGDKTLQNNIIKNSSINNARLSLGSITCNRLLDYQIVIRQYNSHKLCTLLIRGIIEKCQQNLSKNGRICIKRSNWNIGNSLHRRHTGIQ